MITFLCWVIFIIWVIKDAFDRAATREKIRQSAKEYDEWITALEKRNGIRKKRDN